MAAVHSMVPVQQSLTRGARAQVVLLGSKMGSCGDGRTGGGLVRPMLCLQGPAQCGCMHSGSLLPFGSQNAQVKQQGHEAALGIATQFDVQWSIPALGLKALRDLPAASWQDSGGGVQPASLFRCGCL